MRPISFSTCVLSVGFVAIALVSRPSGVAAGTAVQMGIPELVNGAELIIEAAVLSKTCFESQGRIETEYLLRIDRTFAGEDRSYRSIRLPGGVLESGRGMILAGMPRLEAGESTLLFLSRAGATGVRMPVGLMQGKFTVVQSKDGTKTLRRNTAGVTLVTASGAVVKGEGYTVRPYADVVAQIEAALAAKKKF